MHNRCLRINFGVWEVFNPEMIMFFARSGESGSMGCVLQGMTQRLGIWPFMDGNWLYLNKGF